MSVAAFTESPEGLKWQGTLEEGLYEIVYRFEAPDFDVESLYFEWMGHRTGPWDYAPRFAKNRGDCLLPHVELSVTPDLHTSSRVFIPSSPDLERKSFSGRMGFYVESKRSLTAIIKAKSLKAVWKSCELVRFDDFKASYKSGDFKAGQRFWLDDAKVAAIARTWGRSPWTRRIDGILDDCAKAKPPKDTDEARSLVTTLKTKEVYEDSVIFPGDYIVSLCLRLFARDSKEDEVQLNRWVDSLIELPYWGFADDPIGADHNNDLTADFNMFGLATALNWHEARLGKERARRAEAKIAYQADEILKWIIHSRSSWPGTVSQNHSYFGHQTLVLAGLALLGRNDRALLWLNVAIPAFKRFSAALPPDGSFHEGLGYTCFAMTGLMPSLMLLQQFTGKEFIPEAWIEKHWKAVEALLPENCAEGFFVDDADGSLPFMDSMLLWEFARSPEGSETKRRVEGMLSKFYKHHNKPIDNHQLLPNIWNTIWAPQLDSASFKERPAGQGKLCSYLDDNGYVILELDSKTKAFFLTGPSHGYKLFNKEMHPYSYGHHHPDSGNIMLNYDGKWLLADTGYTWSKLSSEHNLLLVNGKGQHNDGHTWMVQSPCDFTPAKAKISEDADGVSRSEIDLECYYPKSLKLKKWRRTVLAAKGEGLAVVDDVDCAEEAELTISWGSDLPWVEKGKGVYAGESGCLLSLYGKDEISALEKVNPARKFIEIVKEARPWHAIRVKSAGKTKSHRFITVFRLPGATESFDKRMLAKI